MILYVNDMKDSAGMANKPETIQYNLDVLGAYLADSIDFPFPDRNEISSYKSIGRYVCMLTLSPEEAKMWMIFVDFKKDEKEAVKFEKQLTVDNGIMQAFYDGLKTYDQDYDLITLAAWENRSTENKG